MSNGNGLMPHVIVGSSPPEEPSGFELPKGTNPGLEPPGDPVAETLRQNEEARTLRAALQAEFAGHVGRLVAKHGLDSREMIAECLYGASRALMDEIGAEKTAKTWKGMKR